MESGSTATLELANECTLAANVKALLVEGNRAAARDLFGDLIALHQRRAARIAYQYLRDAADTDEAVQDAFLKAFTHLPRYREELSFEVWFTRILVNGCLDRLKAQRRRARWLVRWLDTSPADQSRLEAARTTSRSPEDLVLGREQQDRVTEALGRLPERQRLVFVLSHVEGCTPREVSAITGLQESTVRVHLFRAIRRLRRLLGAEPA